MNLSSEDYVIGQLLNNPDTFEEALNQGLEKKHFPNFGEVFELLRDAYNENKPLTSMDLTELWKDNPQAPTGKLGSWAGIPGTLNTQSLVSRFIAEYDCLQLGKAMGEAANIFKNKETIGILKSLDEMQTILGNAVTTDRKRSSTTPNPETNELDLMALLEDEEDLIFKTGIEAIDRRCNGLQAGYIALVARTSEGKTTLAMNIARGVLKDGAKVVFFSEEMNRQIILGKIAAMEAGFDFNDLILRRNASPEDKQKWMDVAKYLSQQPLYVNSSCRSDFNKIESEIRRLHRQGKINFAILDYIQQYRLPGCGDTRVNELAQISSRILGLTTDLKIPIVVCAQLNREYSKTDIDFKNDSWKTNVLHQIRDCGSIEQDAAQVIHIGKEVYTDKIMGNHGEKEEVTRTERFINIAKDRLGNIGSQTINWNMSTGVIR